MCIAAPGKVTRVDPQQVWVDYGEVHRPAMRASLSPRVGDYVLVQMGVVIKILSDKEARAIKTRWRKESNELPLE
ncbi:MAG TPA: HypC/HybG/HupF family hydrogenase formation chaperone [Candidatus Woesebacteria bacterium]|nr:HypC/HybG/HupF family hydrogenase formation chaperone [Candidatus Woesebacteria bacterium]HNS94953.1 HypC/HybG/HupF family hydrogenase formation chaperone [Candidatus Woesebacteria bacterium]